MSKRFALSAALTAMVLVIFVAIQVVQYIRNEVVIGHIQRAVDGDRTEYDLSQAVGFQVRKLCLQTPYMRKSDFTRVSGERVSGYRVTEHLNKLWLFDDKGGSRTIAIDKWQHYRFTYEGPSCADGGVIKFKRVNGETFLYL